MNDGVPFFSGCLLWVPFFCIPLVDHRCLHDTSPPMFREVYTNDSRLNWTSCLEILHTSKKASRFSRTLVRFNHRYIHATYGSRFDDQTTLRELCIDHFQERCVQIVVDEFLSKSRNHRVIRCCVGKRKSIETSEEQIHPQHLPHLHIYHGMHRL